MCMWTIITTLHLSISFFFFSSSLVIHQLNNYQESIYSLSWITMTKSSKNKKDKLKYLQHIYTQIIWICLFILPCLSPSGPSNYACPSLFALLMSFHSFQTHVNKFLNLFFLAQHKERNKICPTKLGVIPPYLNVPHILIEDNELMRPAICIALCSLFQETDKDEAQNLIDYRKDFFIQKS